MTLALDRIDPRLKDAVLALAGLVKRAGGRALMVGGSVRDLLLGEGEVKDVDLEVFGLSADALKSALAGRFPFDECGISFGVLKIKHFDIDVSLPRRESKVAEGHKGFLIGSDPSMSVAEAALRRDFTVNAMYFDPLEGAFEDPYGGRRDLEGKILRHVSERFLEDPLRVLRGMQFTARFGLKPAAETIGICRRMTIENLPKERLFEEWSKFLLKGRDMSGGLAFLRATGWVKYFPELASLIGCEQDPGWHPEGDVWNHTSLCLDSFARSRTGERDEDLIVGFAVLCHDFGKPATTGWDPVKKRLRSLGHDMAGVGPTLSFLKRFTAEEKILKAVPPLVQYHMQPYAMWKGKTGDAAIRRLALRVGRIDRLIRVCRADDEGRLPEKLGGSSGGEDLKWLANEAERLRIAADKPKPILLGRHLIERGMKPGVEFGKHLAAAFEAQLDGEFSDLDGALKYFDKMIKEKKP